MKIQTLPVKLQPFLRRFGLLVTLAFCAWFWWLIAGTFR